MNLGYYKTAITNRLSELGERMHDINTELSHKKPKDLEDQAVDLEDDEVLEGLAAAAQQEVTLLRKALDRIEDRSFGLCLKCGGPISEARLKAVLHAALCRECANHKGS